MNTNLGKISIALDVTNAPCASESFAYLAGKKYFDNTDLPPAHHQRHLTCCSVATRPAPARAARAYTFGHENLPTDQRPTYPAGVVAMANPGNQDANGSQFFIVYQDVADARTDPSTGQPRPRCCPPTTP